VAECHYTRMDPGPVHEHGLRRKLPRQVGNEAVIGNVALMRRESLFARHGRCGAVLVRSEQFDRLGAIDLAATSAS